MYAPSTKRATRCDLHGLMALDEGRCVLCRVEQRRKRGAATLLVCFAGAMTVAFAYAWSRDADVVATARPSFSAPARGADSLARWTARTASLTEKEPFAQSAGEAALPAEDRALSAPPSAVEVGASPAPPRAPIEAERAGTDDPRDFEPAYGGPVEALRAD